MTKAVETTTLYFPPAKRWTVEEYHHMIEAGILNEDHNVELIGGQILQMFPVGRAHANTVNLINEVLVTRKILQKADFIIGVQNPITIHDDTEPEPDVYVAQGPVSRYRQHNPKGEDLLLVIEVAESSLAYDRTAKARQYAKSNIQEYWIVNVYERQVERFSRPDPVGGVYEDVTVFTESDEVDSLSLGNFSVSELLVSYE